MGKTFDDLTEILKKPTLWQRSAGAFWDDDYISKGMLAAHLDQATEAASRKIETIESSVDWLSGLLARNGSVLDLGCGPGLYTKRLSDRGFDVTGVDVSRRSIAYAKENDEKTKYMVGNYLEMDFPARFDAVIMIYCDYAALTFDERKLLLAKVKRALRPDGLFIFDVFTGQSKPDKTDKTSWYTVESGGFWSPEPHLCLEGTYYYENGSVSACRYGIVTEKAVTDYIIWDTAYTKTTLTRELEQSGFRLKALFGDVRGKPYDENSDTMCAVAAVRSRER